VVLGSKCDGTEAQQRLVATAVDGSSMWDGGDQRRLPRLRPRAPLATGFRCAARLDLPLSAELFASGLPGCWRAQNSGHPVGTDRCLRASAPGGTLPLTTATERSPRRRKTMTTQADDDVRRF